MGPASKPPKRHSINVLFFSGAAGLGVRCAGGAEISQTDRGGFTQEKSRLHGWTAFQPVYSSLLLDKIIKNHGGASVAQSNSDIFVVT